MKKVQKNHQYTLHSWSKYEEEESATKPMDGMVYQYDCINDTYYSYISAEDLAALAKDVEKYEWIDSDYFLHLCDDDINGLKDILNLGTEISEVDLEGLSYVAMTQRFGIGNRKISDMLFTLLLSEFDMKYIIEALDNGAYPEVEENYPDLRRSLELLEAKAQQGG